MINFEQSAAILTKINQLHELMRTDGGSWLERDLLMEYVRKLYDLLLSDSEPSIKSSVSPSVAEAGPVKVSAPPQGSVFEILTMDDELVIPPPPTAPVSPPVTSVVSPPPAIPVPPPASSVAPPLSEIEELFEYKPPKELSQRLSESKITTLKGIFSLNDRVKYQSVLFGNQSADFEAAVDYLDRLESFEQARQWLESGPIERYHWLATADRRETAKQFVKLVRRRYAAV